MFKVNYIVSGLIALILPLIIPSSAFASLTELWGGPGLSIQVYEDNRAYFVFDCAKGETMEWKRGASPITAALGTVQTDLWIDKYAPELKTIFSASLNQPNEMEVTVNVENKEPVKFVVSRNRKADFHECFIPH